MRYGHPSEAGRAGTHPAPPLDYSDFKDSIEVPFALSQMGIANAVAIARSNVPRAIAGLKEQGILVERQAHVKGVFLENARPTS